jgi:type I restriction enzyme M protein
MPRPRSNDHNNRKFSGQQSVDSYVKSVCDIMRRSNCAGALQYVPELTWILFLRILDEREAEEAERAEAVGMEYSPSLELPYRWQDWASPEGEKRRELQFSGSLGTFKSFVNGELIHHMKSLQDMPNVAPRQMVISQIFSNVESTRIDTERNLLDILDMVHEIHLDSVDQTHVFTLSQVYEGLLLKMGEKGSDGGQFFTPREIIRIMVQAINPIIGETVYDPACGTGGFLAQSYEHMTGENNSKIEDPDQLDTLKRRTFFGREKDNAIFPISLANMILHGIDEPHVWHGNTLTGAEHMEASSQMRRRSTM